MEFAPELAYVLTDDAGVCGYVLGKFSIGFLKHLGFKNLGKNHNCLHECTKKVG